MSALTMLTLRYTVGGAPVNLAMAGELLFPGLAITPAVTAGRWQGGWQIVHLMTGRSVAEGKTGLCLPCLRHAAASPVFRTVDWTVDGETLLADHNAQAAIARLTQVWTGCGGADCEAAAGDLGVCNCEDYVCRGECCGLGGGGCSCTPAQGGEDR